MGKWVSDSWYVLKNEGWFDTIEQAYEKVKDLLGSDCPTLEQVKDEIYRDDAFEQDGVYLYREYSEHYEDDEEDD